MLNLDLRDLRSLEDDRLKAAKKYTMANQVRNAGIIAAAANGVTVPEIARELGLTRERVRQIIERGH